MIVGTRGREEKRIKLIGIVVEIVGFARFNTRDEKKPALPTAGAFVFIFLMRLATNYVDTLSGG